MKTLIFFASVLLLGCQAPTKPDLQAETNELQKAAEAYNNALAGMNLDEGKTFYAQDALSMPPGAATIRGYDAIASDVDTYKQLKNLAVAISSMEVAVSPSGGSGYSIAMFSLSFDDAEGKHVMEDLRDVHFWVKQPDGTWKITVDIWNAQATTPTP